MKIAKSIAEIMLERLKYSDIHTGFVPTMGFLHEGHLSIARRAVAENEYTVASIFVNPTQFAQGEDYSVYPRDIGRDISLLEKAGVNLLFMPDMHEMYDSAYETYVETDNLSKRLEGKFRPNHFKGVSTVVCKLFNIVRPQRAYFGWKDAQQLIIIKKMVKDLNMNVDIIACETVREADGLALSSRNIYLSRDERYQAVALYKCLSKVRMMIKDEGIRETAILTREGLKVIREHKNIEIQYLEIVELSSLKEIKYAEGHILVAVAVKIGKTRLIDNIRLEL